MTPDRDGPFAGFREPHDHWFKTPHALIDALPSISSMAELKVLLYVLRHTWGYQEYDAGKRITLDEFSHGRKRRDGSRIDNGTGLSTHGAKSGVRAAVAHGFLIRESDGRDAARSAYTYRLRLGPDQAEADRSPVGTPPETDGCPVGTPGGSRRDTRSGKETDAERNQIPPADGGEHGLVGRDQQTGAERRAADEAFERGFPKREPAVDLPPPHKVPEGMDPAEYLRQRAMEAHLESMAYGAALDAWEANRFVQAWLAQHPAAPVDAIIGLGQMLEERLGMRPDWTYESEVSSWLSGLERVLRTADGDATLVLDTALDMRDDGLRIPEPYSLLKMVRDAAAQKRVPYNRGPEIHWLN